MSLDELPFSQIRLVIFDLDGTLYSLGQLRRRIQLDLITYYGWRPHRWREMLWIQRFRSYREALAERPHSQVDTGPYRWLAEQYQIRPERIATVIEDWMLHRPLPYLAQAVYPEVAGIFAALKARDRQVAVLSDFPARRKIEAMGLELDHIFSAHDPEIDQLKPSPRGLLYIADRLGFAPAECLMVGDRDERDGEAARRAGMAYHILPQEKPVLGRLLAWVEKEEKNLQTRNKK